MKKIVIIVLVVIFGLACFGRRCSASAEGEEYPVPTFDLTTSVPTEEPIEPPEIIFETPPVLMSPGYGNQVGWRQYARQKVSGTPGSYLYTWSNGSVTTFVPSYSLVNWSSVMSLGEPLDDSYSDFGLNRGSYHFQAYMIYRTEQVPVGSSIVYSVQLPGASLTYPDSNLTVYGYTIECQLLLTFMDGSVSSVVQEVSLTELSNGFEIGYENNNTSSTIRRSDVFLSIDVHEDSEPEKDTLLMFRSDSGFRLTETVLDSPWEVQQESLIDKLNDFIYGLIFPTSEQMVVLIERETVEAEESSGGLSYGKQVLFRILELITQTADPVVAPTLEIPALSLNLNGENVKYFHGYTFDFGSIPGSIWTYAKMGTSILLVGAFVVLLWNQWSKFLSLNLSGGHRTMENEILEKNEIDREYYYDYKRWKNEKVTGRTWRDHEKRRPKRR